MDAVVKNPFVLMALAAALIHGAAPAHRRGTPQRRGRRFKDPGHGIPKKFRQYAKRYGRGVDDMRAMHLKFKDVPMLDHWRERREAAQRILGILQGWGSEGASRLG